MPRLSSVEEFQEPVNPTMEDTATHLHHTPVTMTTTEEGVKLQDTNSRISDTVTMATNSTLINKPVIITVDSRAVTKTTNSELSNKPITTHNPTASSEVAITVTTNEQEDPNVTITDNSVQLEVPRSAVGDDHTVVIDPEEVEVEVTTQDSV